MPLALTFRPMRLSDREEIRKFYDDMGEESAAFFNVDHGNERRTMAFFDNSKPDHRFFVAEDGGRIAGLLFVWDIDRSVPWLGVAVRDDSGQRRGHFSAERRFCPAAGKPLRRSAAAHRKNQRSRPAFI